MLQKNLHTLLPRLALLTLFCFFIEATRMLITCNIIYIFLPWNLLLAWIPVYLSVQIKEETKTVKLGMYLFLWLLFFPNAPYIITDLLHLKPRNNFPFWYDSLLLFSFAFTGLILGVVSALLVFKKMKVIVGIRKARIFMLLTMLLSGYGIYVGRFLRYNSWDIVDSPFQILGETAMRLIHPSMYPRTYGLTLMSGALLFLVFFIFESILLTE